MWVFYLIVEIHNCLSGMLNLGYYTLYMLHTSTPVVMPVPQTRTASLTPHSKHFWPRPTHFMDNPKLIMGERHFEAVSRVIVTGHTGHCDLSVIQPQPNQSNSSRLWQNPFGWQAKFSTIQVLHSNDHPTHILHPTQGHASALLHQEGQVHTLTPDQTNSSFVPAQAILFLPLSFLLLSHTLNKPAVTLECQSSDADPWHTVTMHNPYNSISWEQNKAWKWF